jgi:hypothetical protein
VYSHEDAPAPLGTARVPEAVQHWVAELAREHECVIHEVDPRSTPGAWLEGDAEWHILDVRQRPAGQIHRWALDSSSDRDGDPAWAWQWIVEHPLNAIAVAGAAPLLLRTEVQARDVPEGGDGAEGRATVVIIRQFATFHGHPAHHDDLSLPPPSLVRRLVEGFSVRRGDIPQTWAIGPLTIARWARSSARSRTPHGRSRSS